MSMSFDPGMSPPKGIIPLCVPEIRGNEWKYIEECLNTNWVSSAGNFVDRFEQKLASYTNNNYAVATCNGTAALHIALLVAGVEPDNEVVVSTLTFIAPANAIRYVGAFPLFMDAEPDHWQMDPQKVLDFLEKECKWRNNALYNKVTDRKVKAIIPVHILGHPVDMDPIIEAARKYELTIIEDATESLGAKYKGRMVGSLGDIACFSFNGNKLITTGGGGMITTDNDKWAQLAKYLTTQAKNDPIEYIHHEIGYNYRLNNIQAAMGCAQIEQVDDYILAKCNIASTYTEAFMEVRGITSMREAEWAFSTFWLYTIMIDKSIYGKGSRDVLTSLANSSIQARPLWQPLHHSPAHSQSQSYHCDVAEYIAQRALSLPSSVGLKKDQQKKVIAHFSDSH